MDEIGSEKVDGLCCYNRSRVSMVDMNITKE